jgi:putative spermidine/putrescine transport system ATP-binding protein
MIMPADETQSLALVRFAAVHKSYDGTAFAVRDLHLEVRRGEFLTLLGPSGSGKTTTLMMLAGFESPSAGEILFEGRPITGTPPHRRNFGMVFQNYALFPHLTVGGNVSYPLEVRGVPRAERERRAEQALATVRLEGLADRRPDQLSGGQRQRVALARALVFEPPLVLMDEPLGALDKQLREHMQVELKDLHRRLGTTFVYVTHDQGEALTLSDRVAVFAGGALQQVDTPEALYERPANRFVAGFVGDTVALAGTLEIDGAIARVALPGGARLEGVNVQAAAPGTPVLACIRPERAGVLHAAATAANTLAATALDAIYFGDHVRLRCALPAQEPVTVRVPLSALPVPAPGTAVALELPARHLRLYT